MKTRQRNLAIVICSLLMAVATFFGIASLSNSTVFASGTPTVTMISGASVRKTEETPGIKFTARIDNFVAGGNYKYGMLILPKEAWDNLGWNENTNYHAYFADKGITDYADKICSPYIDVETGDWCISYSLINLQSYTRSLVGVAYVFDGTNYTYTKVDMSENARSISYVAQMALKNETNLSVEQKNVLKSYANAGLSIEEEDVLTDSLFNKEGATEYVPTDYAVRYTLNSGDTISFYTKKSYPAGTTVSFKYYLPSGTTTQWWGWATTGSIEGADYYATGSESNTFKNTVVGNWATATFKTVSAGYIYLGFESGHWVLDGETPYILLDDFVVGTDKENFSENLLDSIFNTNAGIHESFVVSKQEVGFGEEPSEYSAKIIVDEINSDAGLATFVTKDSYPTGSVVKFKYYMPTDVKVGTWAKLCCVANANSSNIYENWILDLPITQGEWIEKEVTLTSAGYLHFAADVGQWGSGAGYILIDDFTVKTGETTVIEDFNYGLEKSIFNVNTEGAVELGEGYVAPEPEELGEVALKMYFNNDDDGVRARTTTSYAGGSTVSFKYFIPANTTEPGWWGIAWHTDASKVNNYHAAGINSPVGYRQLGNELGVWTDVSFTLPADGPYYLYFGSECDNKKWNLGSGDSYVLIDDFTVNGEVETFNYGVENSIFTILQSNLAGNSETGEGYVDPYPSEIALKMLFNNSDGVRARTTTSYAGGSTVSFKYFIQADTAVQWTRFIWDTDTNCDNYAETFTSFGNTAGEWVTWSYTLPAGGPYYLYFGFECGNWKDSSGAPYILIDDFTVNGEVETFNYGVENSIFTILQSNLAGNSQFGEGYVNPYLGEYGAKITIDLISSNPSTPSFITAEKYTLTSATTVTFDYFMSGNTNSAWWTFNWTTSNTSADIYAFSAPTSTNGGKALPTNQGSWQTASVEIPVGTWYFYFAGAVGEWGDGYVIIDNFKMGDDLLEDFNYENWIFLDNRSSKPDAIVSAEGKEGAAEETPEYDKNSFALVDLVGLGKILDVLENKGGYAYVYGAEIETTDLPESMLFVSGNIKYTITGNKEFALSFGNGYFIFVDETRVAFYKNTKLLKEIGVSGNNEISFAIAANGSISISIANGGYVGLGVMDTAPTRANLVALGGKGSVDFESFKVTNFKVVGEVLENVPQYVSSEAIDFTAYAFDSDNMVSDAGFKLLADAGFTKTLGLLQGRSPSDDLHEQDITGNKNCTCGSAEAHVENLMKEVNADAMAALALAEKYGLKHYVLNSNIYNIERNKNNYEWLDEFANKASYTNHKAFAGHFLADEPKHTAILTNTELEELVNAYKAYRAAFPEGEAFINLLPKTSTLLSSESTYNAYVDYYVNNIAKDKDGVKGTGYVSFDHYPLKDSEVTSSHLRNLELIAEKCRDNSLELRFYIKASCAGDSTRELRAIESKNDLMMQIYSGLVYGGKEVIYYQFTDHTKTDGTAGDGVISGVSLEKTNVYNWAAEVNNEVHAFDAAYNNFKWVSASVFGTGITQTNNLKSKADVYGYISSVSTTGTALIGNFTDLDGKFTHGAQYAYMVMNYGDTGNNQDEDTITITFNGTPTRALVYENGLARVVTLSSNQLTLSLELGEGAFVIPLK